MGHTFKDRSDWRKETKKKFKKQRHTNYNELKGLSVVKDNEILDDDKFIEYEDPDQFRNQYLHATIYGCRGNHHYLIQMIGLCLSGD